MKQKMFWLSSMHHGKFTILVIGQNLVMLNEMCLHF